MCKAVVEASTVSIDGAVEGNITATDKVQLNATARMTGDLVAAKLVVTEGAAFTGHITVGPNALNRPMGASTLASITVPTVVGAGATVSERHAASREIAS